MDTLTDPGKAVVRAHSGPGAGAYLQPTLEDMPAMPDAHFRIILRRRLRFSVCPPGSRCHHRRQDGSICREALEETGMHALKCEVGRARTHSHDRIRDWVASTHQKCTGAFADTEQHVPQWDRINPRTGELERAVLDVATRDPAIVD